MKKIRRFKKKGKGKKRKEDRTPEGVLHKGERKKKGKRGGTRLAYDHEREIQKGEGERPLGGKKKGGEKGGKILSSTRGQEQKKKKKKIQSTLPPVAHQRGKKKGREVRGK